MGNEMRAQKRWTRFVYGFVFMIHTYYIRKLMHMDNEYESVYESGSKAFELLIMLGSTWQTIRV